MLAFAAVTLAAYFTYFRAYAYPAAPFWDENYHIASAQKYLHHIYFMELHPPLGKLLMAAGEALLHPNAETSHFVSTDYATTFPPGFSFAGFRLFSALFGWWTAPVLFGIFLRITGNATRAALLSSLYVFDNALIVHLRGAMLEGPLLLFCALSVWLFFLALDAPRDGRGTPWLWVALGVTLALGVTTKLLALVFVLLPVALVALRRRDSHLIRNVLLLTMSGIAMFCVIWQVHFNRARQINPLLPNDGYYQASPAYRRMLDAGGATSISTLPVMLRDAILFVWSQDRPALDLSKAGENGSPFYFWPVGARAINYRWESDAGGRYRYLYLQSNPVVWGAGLVGVLAGVSLLLAAAAKRVRLKRAAVLAVFVSMYFAYFVGIAQIHSVMYLYHYFIPLLIAFIILTLVIEETPVAEPIKTGALAVLFLLVAASFWFYKPLTYYEPLTDAQVQRRAVIRLWDLKCAEPRR